MKGLMIKDYYCLKTTITTVICICFFSFIICIMCIMSMQYGNLAQIMENMAVQMAEENVEPQMAYIIWRMVISLLIFLPMALVGNISYCFTEDRKADFYKVEASMPLSVFETVSARFSVLVLFGGAVFLFSTMLAIISGLFSPQFSVSALLGMNTVLSSVVIAMVAVGSFFLYSFPIKNVEIILALPILALVYAGNLFVALSDTQGMAERIEGAIYSAESHAWIFALSSLLILSVSYAGSLYIVKHRRECNRPA